MNQIRLKDGFCPLLNADCEFKIVGNGLQIKIIKDHSKTNQVIERILNAGERKGFSKLLNAMVQIELDPTDQTLVIYIGYDSRAFADMEYLKLIGQDVFDRNSKHYNKGTTTAIVKEFYQLEVIPL